MVTATQNGNLTFLPNRTALPVPKCKWTKQLIWQHEAEERFIRFIKLGETYTKFKAPSGNWVVGTECTHSRHWVRWDRAMAIKANRFQMLPDWDQMPPKPKSIW